MMMTTARGNLCPETPLWMNHHHHRGWCRLSIYVNTLDFTVSNNFTCQQSQPFQRFALLVTYSFDLSQTK